jgi:hypothetical protein
MRDDQFEWDDIKAVDNEHDHGISFEMAGAAFRDAFSIGGSIDATMILKNALPCSAWWKIGCCSFLTR